MDKREAANRFLRAFGARALSLYRRFSKGRPDRRCRTCAFREIEIKGVDGWKGWQTSLMGLVRAADPSFAGTKPVAFVCHRARKVKGAYAPHRKPRFCEGYAVLAGRPEFKRAVCEAAIDAECGA